jgi:hypothetical protein
MIYYHDLENGPYGSLSRNHWCCVGVVNYCTFSGVSDCELIIGFKA